MKIAFLHTAEIHVATFDALLAERAPGAKAIHRVEPAWLAEARAAGLTPALQDRIHAALAAFTGADAVLCTCSTLGPAVDAARGAPPAVRIDRPMLARALAEGPNLLLAYMLESARPPAEALLAEIAAETGRPVRARLLKCPGWARFEVGDLAGFADQIAAAIRAEIDRAGPPDAVILAQASMRVAEPKLRLQVPVFSSPVPALDATLAAAQAPSTTS